jgi:hypothetical protein
MVDSSVDFVPADDGVIANMQRRNSQFKWNDQRRGTESNFQDVINEAQQATEHEHKMGIWEAIRTYPKAVGWSVLASTALVMEGYDLVVIGSFYGYRELHVDIFSIADLFQLHSRRSMAS